MKNILLLTFLITAIWDIVLRYYPLKKRPDFRKVLDPYFEKHGVIEAAVIAGIVGFVTQIIILSITNFPTKTFSKQTIQFLVISFLISGLIGFPLERCRFIPSLTDTYYKDLGRPRSFFTDAYSGLVVQFSLLFLVNIL